MELLFSLERETINMRMLDDEGHILGVWGGYFYFK